MLGYRCRLRSLQAVRISEMRGRDGMERDIFDS